MEHALEYFVILLTVTICLSSIDNALILFCCLFSRAGESRGGVGKPRSVRVRKWLSDKRKQRYGHYSTLLNELKTDEKAFFIYTRLPRHVYNEVLQRKEGRIERRTLGTESPSLLVSSCPSLYDTWPVGTVIQACLKLQSSTKHYHSYR